MSQTIYDWVSTVTGNVIIEAWGAGGGGRTGAGGGGGGAAYARTTARAVVTGVHYTVAVADAAPQNTDGDLSYFSSLSDPVAAGGKSGLINAGGAGGLVADCVGTTKYAGGAGAYPSGAGGGGGSADDYSAGNSASGATGGAARARGGAGGNGQSVGTGDVGGSPGGGAGGGDAAGGAGSKGAVVIWIDNGSWPPTGDPIVSYGATVPNPYSRSLYAFMMH